MAETTPHPAPAPTIPQKRLLGFEDKHTPAVASPLNPDLNASRTKMREPREKKATYKARGASPEPAAPAAGKKSKKPTKDPSVLSPLKYTLPTPKTTDFDAPKAPQMVPTLKRAHRQFYEATEHISNKRNFRYTRCICDPSFPHSQYHRQSETEPFGPRISFEDASSHILFDQTAKSLTTEKGFRLARTTVGCREGRWYYECKILSGNKSSDAPDLDDQENGGHVRMGWARREASLDGPVGFDAYSYGLRDVGGQKMHMSRPKDFVSTPTDFTTGDVIGLEISLPSLSLHRKVVTGVYNKAVDVTDDLDPAGALDYQDTIRDRIPIRYKTHLYFEQFEYHPTKDLEELMNPGPTPSTTTGPNGIAIEADPPNPNHPQIPLRTLPFSSIKVYKNGQLLGTPFTDLLSFLPPASKPLTTAGAREGLDDGMLGYFPAVSVFRGGAAECNFGPDFWYPPPDLASQNGDADGDVAMGNTDAPAENTHPLTEKRIAGAHSLLRPMSERYDEQIAEDVVYDIIDEVDFWAQDDGETPTLSGKGLNGGVTVVEAPGVVAVAAADESGGAVPTAVAGEIREILQQDE